MSGPWMKFYPSDWRADPALRMCSIAARGLWMEMLCLMHEADGSLAVNGKQLLPRQLAALAGVTTDEVMALLSELADAGVFSRDENGTIYSRRMRKDIAKAEQDKANGKKGGNPAVKGGVNPHDNPPVGGGDKAQKPEARDQKGSDASASARPEAALSAIDQIWTDHPRVLADMSGKPETAVRKWIGKALAQHAPEAVLEAIKAAISAGTGDPFAYITRCLNPPPSKNRGPPNAAPTQSVHDVARALERWTAENEQQPTGQVLALARR